MIDGHIHIERGNYSIAWINEFVKYALEREISEIHLLEHSHRFKAFAHTYENISNYNEYQKDWLNRNMKISLETYKAFVLEMKQIKFPIKVMFGLEVCYIEEAENNIRDIISDFNWDFVTGSVHWIDGWGFDHKKEFWGGKDIDKVYSRYYEIMEGLIKSKLFDIVAHPDSIKCFGHQPTYDLSQIYSKIADLLNENHMFAEQSAGLYINYGFDEFGMNHKMLEIFRSKGVKLLTVSDAHKPEDVGRYIREMNRLLI
jgi:histidinol-phosphatase (PHP family)